ncbi:MAG: 2-C-methyl-D-erythritol 4-phosphate cytidylyltransferase, partial [Pseudomonadota bacterium]
MDGTQSKNLAPFPSFAAVIVAAGKGLRVGGDTPKQFRLHQGRPVLEHSVKALVDAGASPLVIVAPDGLHPEALSAAGNPSGAITVSGGATRQASVRAGLEALAGLAPERVLIHDAARPHMTEAVIDRLLEALQSNEGAIPTMPVVDSLAIVGDDATMSGKAEREKLCRVQTPQAFRYSAILKAHRAWSGEPNAGDDAQVLLASQGSVALVEGDERLKKITFAEDLMDHAKSAPFRVGQGYDVHRLEEGEELWLGGIQL